MKKTTTAVLGLLAFQMVACGGGSSPVASTTVADPAPRCTVIGTSGGVDPALVGTWTGSVNGSGGPASTTMRLNISGAMQIESNRQFYTPASGTWGVSGTRFTFSAVDNGGLNVSFLGTLSGTSISGDWCASNGTSGTASMTLQ